MNNAKIISAPKFSLLGFGLASLTGAMVAGVVGYAYFFLANRLHLDFILVVAPLVGMGVGWAVGMAARLGRLRSSLILIVLGLIFGVAGYAIRYYFEFNDFVELVVVRETLPDSSAQATRQEFLEEWAKTYPPGGFLGYFWHLAEVGITLTGDRMTFDPATGMASTESTIQGAWVWALFGLEMLLAGVMGAGMARATGMDKVGA